MPNPNINRRIVRRGDGIFTITSPADLPGLANWMDVTTVGPFVDGTRFSPWPDLSGNGRNWVQDVANSGPRFFANQQNGLPTAYWEAGGGMLGRCTWGVSIPQPTTYFIVCRYLSVEDVYGVIFDGITAGSRHLFYQDGGGHVPDQFDMFAGSTAFNGPTADRVGYHTWCSIFNGASSQLRKDRVLVATGNPGSDPTTGLRIGVDISNTGQSIMYAGEFIFYSRLLEEFEIVAVENYLQKKWGTP